MKRLAIFTALALASNCPSYAQESDSEARSIFRAWKTLDENASGPWEKYDKAPVSPTAVWSAQNALGEVFWIDKADLKSNGNWVSFWMNGFHLTNPKVNYRRSLWKITILCHGALRLEAVTKYAANGEVIEEKDYRSFQTTAIRPGTMYDTIAKTFCP